jgi:hypothetical protein
MKRASSMRTDSSSYLVGMTIFVWLGVWEMGGFAAHFPNPYFQTNCHFEGADH